MMNFRVLLPKSMLIIKVDKCRKVGCKDGRWKELSEGCLMKVLILAVMNLVCLLPDIWSTGHSNRRLLIKIFVENQCVMSTGPPQTSNF